MYNLTRLTDINNRVNIKRILNFVLTKKKGSEIIIEFDILIKYFNRK